jgi:hypothetical protein
MLHRSNGMMQHWLIMIQTGFTATGVILLTLFNKVHAISVASGMTAMQVMYAIQSCQSLIDEKMKSYPGFNLITVEAEYPTAENLNYDDTIDFNGTGVSGSLQVVMTGRQSTDTWIYREAFNQRDFDLHVSMNVFQFTFSRWSTGIVQFSKLDSTNTMVTLHTWDPPNGFNTSIPYTPRIQIRNSPSKNSGTTVVSSAKNTLRTSMASISSGTPSTGATRAVFSTTFTAVPALSTDSINTAVALLTVPRESNGVRNYRLASVSEVRINVKTSVPVRVEVHFNSQVNTVNPTVPVSPLSCVRKSSPLGDAEVYGGTLVYSIFIQEDSHQLTYTPSQLWLAPGTNLSVSAKAASADPVSLCTINLSMSWSEH